MIVSDLMSSTTVTSEPAVFTEKKKENKTMTFNAFDYTNLIATLTNTNTREENEKKQRISDRKEYINSLCREMSDAGVFADMEGLSKAGKIAGISNCLRMHTSWGCTNGRYRKLLEIMKGSYVQYFEYIGGGKLKISLYGQSYNVTMVLSPNGIRDVDYCCSEDSLVRRSKCVEWFRDNYSKIRDIELEEISAKYEGRIIAEDCVR